MEVLELPRKLVMTGNIVENWKRFKQRFELYMDATGWSEKSMKQQSVLFLYTIGEEALDIYDTFEFQEFKDKYELQKLYDKFDHYFTPKTSVTIIRFHFNQAEQERNETFHHFLIRVKNLSKECEYGDLTESLICDRIACGIKDSRTKERLLMEDQLTLDKVINICRTAELGIQRLDSVLIRNSENGKCNSDDSEESSSAKGNVLDEQCLKKPNFGYQQRWGRQDQREIRISDNKCGKYDDEMNQYSNYPVQILMKQRAPTHPATAENNSPRMEGFSEEGLKYNRQDTITTDNARFVQHIDEIDSGVKSILLTKNPAGDLERKQPLLDLKINTPLGPVVEKRIDNFTMSAPFYPKLDALYSSQGVPNPPQGAPYPPQGAPYPPQGVPYAPQGLPYHPQGTPYPPQGFSNPQQGIQHSSQEIPVLPIPPGSMHQEVAAESELFGIHRHHKKKHHSKDKKHRSSSSSSSDSDHHKKHNKKHKKTKDHKKAKKDKKHKKHKRSSSSSS